MVSLTVAQARALAEIMSADEHRKVVLLIPLQDDALGICINRHRDGATPDFAIRSDGETVAPW